MDNRPKISVDRARCTGCGKCVPVCPVRAITLQEEKAVVDAALCILCTSCVAECETDAVQIPVAGGAFVRGGQGHAGPAA